MASERTTVAAAGRETDNGGGTDYTEAGQVTWTLEHGGATTGHRALGTTSVAPA